MLRVCVLGRVKKVSKAHVSTRRPRLKRLQVSSSRLHGTLIEVQHIQVAGKGLLGTGSIESLLQGLSFLHESPERNLATRIRHHRPQ